MQNTQDQSQRPLPPITLSLIGTQSPNSAIPIVYKPLKDNTTQTGNLEIRPRSFDASSLLTNQNFRQKKSNFEIKLPNPNARSIITSQSISAKPYSPQEFPTSILFSNESLSMVFTKLIEAHHIKITPESITAILNIITSQLYEILIRAAQSSRQRTNVYAPPMSEREITSAPKIKQNFLDCEVVSANNIRNKLFNINNIDENDPYDPFFYKTFDVKKTDLFSPDLNCNERNEQLTQMRRIFQTLKFRGEMFKTVAHEVDSTFSNEIDKYLANFTKNEKAPLTKSNPPHPKANEIFGKIEDENKKKSNRKITPKDIFEALSRMSINYQSEIPLWRLKYFEQADAYLD